MQRRLIEAGLGDRALRIVRHDDLRDAAKGGQRISLGAHPVGRGLAPGRLHISKRRCAKAGHKNLRLVGLASARIDHDRDRCAGKVDEHFLAGLVGLAHRWRQFLGEGAEQVAKSRIAITVRIGFVIFLPDQRLGHVRSLQILMDRRPIRLGLAAHPAHGAFARLNEQPRRQGLIGQRFVQRPFKAGRRRPLNRRLNR